MAYKLPANLTHGLTERTVAFVELFVAQGGKNAERAAVQAGFAKSGAQAHASRLLRDARVLALLRHITETRLRASVVSAMEVMELLKDDPTCPPAVRLKAAEACLDRGGMLLERVSTMHHVVEDRRRSNAGDLRELIDTIIGLDVGVAVVDPAKLERALMLAAQRDSTPALIDITPDDETPESNAANISRDGARSCSSGADRALAPVSVEPEPIAAALSDEALAAIL